MFFLRAAQWALKQGASINTIRGNKSVLDHVNEILDRDVDVESQECARSLRNELVAKGAVTYKERIANTDYYKELDYLNA
jgi:cobyric acid synthase